MYVCMVYVLSYQSYLISFSLSSLSHLAFSLSMPLPSPRRRRRQQTTWRVRSSPARRAPIPKKSKADSLVSKTDVMNRFGFTRASSWTNYGTHMKASWQSLFTRDYLIETHNVISHSATTFIYLFLFMPELRISLYIHIIARMPRCAMAHTLYTQGRLLSSRLNRSVV